MVRVGDERLRAHRLSVVALASLVLLVSLVDLPRASARGAHPWIAVAGDIACPPGRPQKPKTCLPQETAALWRRGGVIGGSGLKAALTLGDNQYPNGSLAAFEDPRRCGGARTCGFDASWGAASRSYRQRVAIWAAAGFHDWKNPDPPAGGCTMRDLAVPTDACGLWRYGQDRTNVVVDPNANEGMYVRRVQRNSPHPLDVVILDGGLCNVHPSSCAAADSTQATFLRSRLASLPAADCVVVALSHAPFSAYGHGDLVGPPSDITYMTGVWEAMFAPSVDAAHRPDLLVAAHDHEYQRFTPMDVGGVTGVQGGVPEIVVGTGGGGIDPGPADYPAEGDHQRSGDCPRSATCYPPEAVDLHFGVVRLAIDPQRGRISTTFFRIGGNPRDAHRYGCS